MATYFYTTIDDPLGSSTSAYGINASGQIVGSYGDNLPRHGFLYDAGSYTTLDGPLGQTAASGINDSGHIVGVSVQRPKTPARLSTISPRVA